jgi:hypothetical protein
MKRGQIKDSQERRELQRRMKKTLTPEQRELLTALIKERNEKNKALRQERENRLERMLGARDAEKHKENMSAVREQRRMRKEEAKKESGDP